MLAVNDTLDAVLLGAFLFGLVFTSVSLLLGAADIGLHSFHVDGPHGPQLGPGGHDAHAHGGESVSPFTVGSVLAFLTWFGGVAYLARNGLGIVGVLAIALGIAAGIAGGWIVFRVLRVLAKHDDAIDPETERAAMAFGQVLTPIRAGGTGEIVYQNRGVRQTVPARAVNQDGIPAGAEVIVLQRVGGFALVQRWDGALDDAESRRLERVSANGNHDPALTSGDSA